MHQEGAIGLEHQEAHRLGQSSSKAARVEDFATGDDETHCVVDRTVRFGQALRVGEMSRFCRLNLGVDR